MGMAYVYNPKYKPYRELYKNPTTCKHARNRMRVGPADIDGVLPLVDRCWLCKTLVPVRATEKELNWINEQNEQTLQDWKDNDDIEVFNW